MDAIPTTQDDRRRWLIDSLLAELASDERVEVPPSRDGQRALLRALLNVRPPKAVSTEFIAVQDAYLHERCLEKGITRLEDLVPLQPHLYVWRSDITTLATDGIVNAANSQMLGCFVPNHGCIDNAIHTFAGVQLRLACAEQMAAQGHGSAREGQDHAGIQPPGATRPAHRRTHRGPKGDPRDQLALASCYRSCLELAARSGLRSLAFCCISTGEFHYPNDQAARIAVDTVRSYLQNADDPLEVVFNVFKPVDDQIYRDLLQQR